MGALEIVVILALLATIVAMLMGIFSMGGSGAFDREHSVQFMYARIGLQGAAVAFMLLALYFR